MPLTKSQIAGLITAATVAINLVALMTGTTTGFTCTVAKALTTAVYAAVGTTTQ